MLCTRNWMRPTPFIEAVRAYENGNLRLQHLIHSLSLPVGSTLEALRDSRFLASAASLAAQQAQRLKSTFVTFDGNIMMNKLVTLMGGRDAESADVFKWNPLGELASRFSSRIPTADFL